jgi:hypothetical protein
MAGAQMSTSLNTTLTTFDALMKRFGVGETSRTKPPKTNAEPFRIGDYTASAEQLGTTARQLRELLDTLDQTAGSTNMAQLAARAQTGGEEIVDHVFWRAVQFAAIALVAGLVYRFLGARLARAQPFAVHHNKISSPPS